MAEYFKECVIRFDPQGSGSEGREGTAGDGQRREMMRETGFNWQQLERQSQDREGWRDFLSG